MGKTFKFFSIFSIILFLGIIAGAIILSSLNIFDNISTQEDATDYYKITDYNYAATYKKNGTMEVKETITAYFKKPLQHGIFRALPEVSKVKYDDGTTKIDKKFRLTYYNAKCLSSGVLCETESSSDIYYIRLGNPNSYIPAGSSKEYKLTYTIKLDSRFPDYNLFYFNVLGNLWDTTIDNFSATVNFEEEIENCIANTKVYYGTYGSTEELTAFNWLNNGKSLSLNAINLGIGEGITVKVNLQEGYAHITPPNTLDAVMLIVIILAIILFVWLFRRHNNKSVITPVVQFKASPKFTSADVGYIVDKKVNSEDVASLIVYWADKGFLEIIEEEKKTYIKSTGKDLASMKMYEKILYNSIFFDEVDKVDIKKIGEKIQLKLPAVKKAIATENSHMFNNNAVWFRGLMIVICSIIVALAFMFVNYQNVNTLFVILSPIIGFFTAFILFSTASYVDKKYIASNKKSWFSLFLIALNLVGLIAFAIKSYDSYCDPFYTVFLICILYAVLAYLVLKFNVRTNEGCKNLGDLVGLKNFIETAEKNRLKMLAKDNPQMFYSILPYAYVLGVYDEWCKKFESIDIGAPSYFHSDTNTVFTILYFNTIFHSTTNSILNSINTANLANTAKNIGTGFGGFGGGGGFSGGGMGGGGGGHW